MSKKKDKYWQNTEYQPYRVNKISFDDNPEQQELVRLMNDKNTKIIFCTGNAGTGKTFTAIYTAVQLIKNKKYNKIIYSRNPVQLGEEMGFLPGDVAEKFNPFMACLFDNLNNIEQLGGPTAAEMKHYIEITPIAFLRGRSLEQSILIIDEAQNLDLVALKAILTRIGEYCKVILLGSMNQIDDRHQAKKEACDFLRVMNHLGGLEFVSSIELTQSKRSKICALVDEKLGELK